MGQNSMQIYGFSGSVLGANQQQGVIHRDISPKNILVTDSSIRIVDFGNAYLAGIQDQIIPCGTPFYYPPEMFETVPNPRIDIFSLAVTLHYFFFSFVPYDEHYNTNPSYEQTIHIPLKRVLDKGASLNPDDRYQSVASFKQAICEALGT